MNAITLHDRVLELEAQVKQLPQVEPFTEHFFAKDMYARTVFSPAGTVIVGKVHKTEHFYVVMSGRVRMTTPDGVMDATGPKVFVCKPGSKRAVYVIEDAWRMTVHPNPRNETDLAKLETELVEDDPAAPFGVGNKLKQELLP